MRKMMTRKYLSFVYFACPHRLPSHPWAVLGEGCSSARRSCVSDGRFYFPQQSFP